MTTLNALHQHLTQQFSSYELAISEAHNELTVEVAKDSAKDFLQALKTTQGFQFEQLIDLCGIDYSTYGQTNWPTEGTTLTGFSRGRETQQSPYVQWHQPRFAVIYHLLSVTLNHRLRVRVFADSEPPMIDSVIDIWRVANFFEREAFDLYGILFKGHPDLRRVLTDYGFIGHPFRKDFPISGYVEPRYDAAQGRVIYEPVDIKPRTLVPRVIREDNRYQNLHDESSSSKAGN